MRLFLYFALTLAGVALIGSISSNRLEPLDTLGEGTVDAAPAPGGADGFEPVYTILDVHTYPVTGATEADVLMSLRTGGPDGGEFFGLTETEMEYRYHRVQEDTGCRLDRIRLDLHVVVTLPEWEPSEDAPSTLHRDWARFDTALRRHEDGHRELAEWGAREIYYALRELRTPTCETIDEAAQAVARRLREQGEARQVAFDRRTGHGRTQGAVWPQSAR